MRASGNQGRFRLAVTTDGRFVRRVRTSFPDSAGFDGRTGWRVDPTGMPRRSALWELDCERLFAAAQAGTWRDPASGVALTGAAENAGIAGRPAIAALTANGRAALSVVLESNQGREELRLSDHRDIDGFSVAFAADHMVEGNVSTSYRVDGARFETIDAGELAMPTDEPDDVGFASAVETVGLRRAASGHLLVAVRVDDVDAGWFILDSGASHHCVSPGLARRLGLEQIGETTLRSMLGSSAAPIRRARTLSVVGVTLRDPQLVEMDLSPFTEVMGVELAGIVGYDLFRRAVVEVDLGKNVLSLRPRAAPPPDVAWLPLIIEQGTPVIRGSLAGSADLLFRLDLGAAAPPFGYAVLARHAVDELGLTRGQNLTELIIGPGMEFDIGELASIEVGGRRFERMQVAFTRGRNLIVGDPFTAGNVGATLFGDLRVVFDYGRNRWGMLPPLP